MKKSSLVLPALALVGVLFLASCATAPESSAVATPSVKLKNIALGKSISSNGHIYDYVAPNAVDGEVLSYFEGPANNFPNIITLDLGQASVVKSQVIKLNPKRIWQGRNQTIEVEVSDDGTVFTTVVPATVYSFDPVDNNNAVTLPWEGTTQFIRLVITANSEATAGQIAEWEVMGE